MNPLKNPLAWICILFFVLSATSPVWAQPENSEPKRKPIYIAGNKIDTHADSKGRKLKKRSIPLERSELSTDSDNSFLEKETFEMINLKRLERGLPALKWNQRVADLARKHSENMAVYGFFSHYGLNGRTVDSRAVDFGINDWSGIGENIAFNKGIDNPTSFTVDRWMKSEGHKLNLLDGRWKESGLGIAVTKDGKYFFTQIFILK